MNYFASSRPAAAALALLYAAAAIPLVFVAVGRARVQYLTSRPASFEAVSELCSAHPSNAECAASLALLAEKNGIVRLDLWDQAVQLNRQNDSLIIQAALAFEMAGDAGRAERLYLEAAALSHTWLPRWTLANFHARRGNTQGLKLWARRALERGYGDRSPLFDLCLSNAIDYGALLNEVIPRNHVPSLESYLLFLRTAPDLPDRAGALGVASMRLLDAGRAEALPETAVDQLVLSADFLARTGSPALGYTLWRRLASDRLLPEPFRPNELPLIDAGFSGIRLAAPGFGWETAAVEGAEVLAGSPAGGVKIDLSGKQPESFDVLSEIVRFPKPGRWTLSFEADSSGDPMPERHLRWVLRDLGSGEELPPQAAGGEGSGNVKSWVSWDVPEGAEFLRLSLVHRRPQGSARMTGEYRIRALRLAPGEPPK